MLRLPENSMRIFISHSWRDKTTADQLARDLGGMAEVWMDIEQLLPGDAIQPTIDDALANVDLVVVLWSEHAARSNGVAEELATSVRTGRRLIPCMLDDTPLGDDLAGTLAIAFDSYESGFGRLCIAILRHVSADLGIDAADELNAIKGAEGVLNYVQDYRNRNAIGGPSRDYWIERIVSAMNAMSDRVTRLQERVQHAGDFVQRIYGKLEDAGEDRARVQEVLHDVIRNEHIAPDILQQVRGHIERYLAMLPAPSGAAPREPSRSVPQSPSPAAALSPPTAPLSPSGPTPPLSSSQPTPPLPDLTARAEGAAAGLGSPGDDEARRQLKGRLRALVAPEMAAPAAELLHGYIASAPGSLQALSQLAAAYRSAAAGQVVSLLMAYLENPNDLLPEAQYGVWGMLDDAWLIHNTAYRLVEAGLVPAGAFPVQWDRVASADTIAAACLPPMIRQELENYLIQLLGLIAAEVNAYSPQFTHDRAGYHPNMGQAGATGGLDREMSAVWNSLENSLSQISLDGWSASLE